MSVRGRARLDDRPRRGGRPVRADAPRRRDADGAEGRRVLVDLKAATVGRGSKVPHLSYVGDAEIGEDVNIGAGTITINFDGYDKHRTVIEDGARIGSDTMLIAPVRVGRDANTGAGSVITQGRAAGRARGRARRAEERGRVPGPEGRGAPQGEALSVEIMTKKRMMLYSGTIHPTLAHEIAENLGIPVSAGRDSGASPRARSTSAPRSRCAAPTCSSCRPTTSP